MAFAKQSESSGGKAIKFYSTLRCEFKNAGQLKDDKDKEVRVGQKININIEKLKKSRLERPSIKEVSLMNENGFDLPLELLEAGKLAGMIQALNTRTFEFNGVQFSRADWPQVIQDSGGARRS